MSDPQAKYTQQEINEIIKRALGEQARNEREISHSELVEIAAEAGIEREALERATAELAQARTQEHRTPEAVALATSWAHRDRRLDRLAARLREVSGDR